MKYKRGNYFQISHEAIQVLNEKEASPSTKWLFIVLCQLEHRFTGANEDFFFRSNEDLKKDSGLSGKTIVEGHKFLKKIGLIKTWPMHWIDKETKKKSYKHVKAFRILDDFY